MQSSLVQRLVECLTAAVCLSRQSPFHIMFNGQHAMLSPAEAHSGFEDHNGKKLTIYHESCAPVKFLSIIGDS